MDHLLTEAHNPASTNLDELTPLEIVRLMNAEDAQVPAAVAAQAEAIARAIEVIADRLRAGGRLVYAGAGTSGRLGILDATECPPTFNSSPDQVRGIIAGGARAITQAVEGAEDHPEYAEEDLTALKFCDRDVLVGIATSGRTPYVLGAAEYAQGAFGGYTIGLACNPDSELSGCVDLPITIAVGPEVLSGSTRLKAGTATKLVLNMLTTGAMVRLGKTYGNLMIDLRATNFKLNARTNRILRHLTGLTSEQAHRLLVDCNRELKTALVAQFGAISPEDARQRLQAAGGQVRQALVGLHKPPGTQVADELILGIDGGGTHTVAILARRDRTVVGTGRAGPSNIRAVGGAVALASLDTGVAAAFADARLPRTSVAAACLGLAGADRAEEQQMIHAWADRVGLAGTVNVTNDAALLLAAGTPEGWGLAVVSGTGSMTLARAKDGRTARAGGWGYLLGDEGSGYVIALAGLQAVTRDADSRGPSTLLSERILQELGLKLPQELIATVYGGKLSRAAMAGLAPLVVEVAEAGDVVAIGIVNREAEALAQTATVAVERIMAIGAKAPLALAGGMFVAQTGYRQRFLAALARCGVQAEPVTVVVEPAEGAVRLAIGLLAK